MPESTARFTGVGPIKVSEGSSNERSNRGLRPVSMRSSLLCDAIAGNCDRMADSVSLSGLPRRLRPASWNHES